MLNENTQNESFPQSSLKAMKAATVSQFEFTTSQDYSLITLLENVRGEECSAVEYLVPRDDERRRNGMAKMIRDEMCE